MENETPIARVWIGDIMINFSEIRNRISVIGIELTEDGKGNIVTAMVDGGMAVENVVFTSMDTLREYVLKDMQNFDEERIKEANEGQMFDFIIPAGEPCPYEGDILVNCDDI